MVQFYGPPVKSGGNGLGDLLLLSIPVYNFLCDYEYDVEDDNGVLMLSLQNFGMGSSESKRDHQYRMAVSLVHLIFYN